MRRISFLVLVVLAVQLVATDVRALDLKKRYPEFVARKDSLGPITLLVESAVLVDVDGDIKQVELSRSRALADVAAQSFTEALTAKGQRVDHAVIASVGGLISPIPAFDLGEGAPQGSAPVDSSRLRHAPFYLDSVLVGRPTVSAAWGGLCRRLLGYLRGNKKPPDYVPEPIQLRDSLGTGALGVVIISGWKVPTGKQIRQGVLTTLLSGGLLTAHKTSVSRMEFALLDGQSGEILWADSYYQEADVNEKMLRKFATSSAEALP